MWGLALSPVRMGTGEKGSGLAVLGSVAGNRPVQPTLLFLLLLPSFSGPVLLRQRAPPGASYQGSYVSLDVTAHGGTVQLTTSFPSHPCLQWLTSLGLGKLGWKERGACSAHSFLANPSPTKYRNLAWFIILCHQCHTLPFSHSQRGYYMYITCDTTNSGWAHLGHAEQYCRVTNSHMMGIRHQHILGTDLDRTVGLGTHTPHQTQK